MSLKLRMLMLALIYFGALVQLYLPAWPVLGGAKPPVLAALALHYALHLRRSEMWLPVIWAAVLHDSLDPGPYGPALLAFPLLALPANRVRSEIFVDGLVTQLICGALCGMLVTLAALLFYRIGGIRPLPPLQTMVRVAGAALLGMLTLPAVSGAVRSIENALPKRRGYGWQ